jgi:uncharacterized protein YfkK (UPF0435 family)
MIGLMKFLTLLMTFEFGSVKEKGQMMNRAVIEAATVDNVEVGDFVQYAMVTDTKVLEVVGKTAKSIKLRETLRTGVKHDGGGLIVFSEVAPNLDGELVTLRERKEGGFKIHRSYGKIFHARIIDGAPVERTDWGF